MVHAGYGCVCHDGHAAVQGFGWVVEDCVEVWVFGEAEACDAGVGAVED